MFFLMKKFIFYYFNFDLIQNNYFNMRTSLHLAVDKENEEIIKLLLHHKGIDTTVKDQI